LFYVPILNKRWWKEVVFELKWYLFLEAEPKKYVGHNPLAQIAMFFFMTLGITFMIVTGWALYAEGAQAGSFSHNMMGWLIGWVGNTQILHSVHHLGMWFIVIFMIIHIYAAIREDILSRQSMVSTMISGTRTFKDDRPE
jgi:Ni/Fe-hydrogenase 1 B-type cytochrome subunit